MTEHHPEVEAHTDTPYCTTCREDWPCQIDRILAKAEEHLDYQHYQNQMLTLGQNPQEWLDAVTKIAAAGMPLTRFKAIAHLWTTGQLRLGADK